MAPYKAGFYLGLLDHPEEIENSFMITGVDRLVLSSDDLGSKENRENIGTADDGAFTGNVTVNGVGAGPSDATTSITTITTITGENTAESSDSKPKPAAVVLPTGCYWAWICCKKGTPDRGIKPCGKVNEIDRQTCATCGHEVCYPGCIRVPKFMETWPDRKTADKTGSDTSDTEMADDKKAAVTKGKEPAVKGKEPAATNDKEDTTMTEADASVDRGRDETSADESDRPPTKKRRLF